MKTSNLERVSARIRGRHLAWVRRVQPLVVQFPGLPKGISPRALAVEGVRLVQTTTLDVFREFVRAPNAVLAERILRDGIEIPLTLSYNPDNGHALLTAGNNRLAIALFHEIPELPVCVVENAERVGEKGVQVNLDALIYEQAK